jgi:hypothetical protein
MVQVSGALGGSMVTFNGTLTKDGKDDSKWRFVGTMEFKITGILSCTLKQ